MLLFGSTMANAGFVADGSLADWGSNNSWATDTWTTGLTGTGTGFTYAYFNDDLIGNQGHSATLGPNAGGQDYDAEFMGVAKIGNSSPSWIVTGQRADNAQLLFTGRYSVLRRQTGFTASKLAAEWGQAVRRRWSTARG
ncbi:MAG: hypothetical protein U0992_06510 [Planctomycetaceae bacterium]